MLRYRSATRSHEHCLGPRVPACAGQSQPWPCRPERARAPRARPPGLRAAPAHRLRRRHRGGRRCRWRPPGPRRPSPRRRHGRTARSNPASAETAPRARRGRVEAGQLVLGDRAQEVDSVGDPKRVSPAAQLTLEGPGPGAAQSQAIVTCHGLEQHGHALVSGRAGRRSPPRSPPSTASRGAAGRNIVGIDAERDDARHPGEPLALARCARLAVAHADACRVTEGPRLEPAEWRRVALLEVLGGVEHVGRPLPAQPSAAAGSRPSRGRTAPRGRR